MDSATSSRRLYGGARTFGCEFEWSIAFLWEDEEEQLDRSNANIPPAIRVPRNLGYDPADESSLVAYVHDDIRLTLEYHGIPLKTPRGMLNIEDLREYRLALYDGWEVKIDSSIKPPNQSEYHWCPVEITSPAEVASEESFSAITYVVNLLASKYRINVNPSCGLHVHVGQGADFLELGALRRVAGLLWAADPLLGCLHPPSKRFCYYSQSLRERTRLARGATAADFETHMVPDETCGRYIGREVRHGEESVHWREINADEKTVIDFQVNRLSDHFKPFVGKEDEKIDEDGRTSQDTEARSEVESSVESLPEVILADDDISQAIEGYHARDTPETGDNIAADSSVTHSLDRAYKRCLGRNTARIPLPSYTAEDEDHLRVVAAFGCDTMPPLDPKAQTNVGAFLGIGEIFSCPSSCVLCWVLRCSDRWNDRPNYNFAAYDCLRLTEPKSNPRTIEFREAAGTTSGKWAETWARICVGLVDWAERAPVDEYLAILNRCDEAAKGGKYDIVDLLDQIGLFAEVIIVEKWLQSGGARH
ncbi:hypothetical protein DL764_004939 [Monosporascus ibericus]|uniref:Amidoligase enzyme n=1 Tax=Monosporascus ibericus TaxID=155417 RepID=A0A4Q4TDM7_9PEZI|nr:hypothetical protein DL764_004939 [Monosporascus ibericus]